MTDFLDDTTLKRFRPQRGSAPSTFSSLAPDPLSANLAGDVDTAPGTGAIADPGAPIASAAPKPYDNKEGYGLLTENSQLADASNPMVQQFVQRFGQSPAGWDRAEYQDQQLGGYVVGRGTPTFSGNGIDEFAVDPSRVAYFDASGNPTDQPAEDGWYVIEGGNARGDAIASMQDVDSRQRNREAWQSNIPTAFTGLPIGHGPLVEDTNRIARVVGPALAAYFLGPSALSALGAEGAGAAAAASPWVEGSTGLLELGSEAAGATGELGATVGSDFLGEELGSELLGEAGADLPPTLPEPPGVPPLETPLTAPSLPGPDLPPGIDANFVPPGVANPTLSNVTPNIPAPPEIPGATNPGLLSRMLGKITDNPLTAAGLGLTAYNAVANKPQGIGAELKEAAKPISDQAASLLAQYGRGEINPGDEFNINKWEHDQIARAQSFYASSGQGESTAALAAVGAIQQQAQAMRNQALQGLLQAGLQASGMALGPLTQAIQAQAAEDQQFAHATSSALQSLLLLQAMGTKTPGLPGTGG